MWVVAGVWPMRGALNAAWWAWDALRVVDVCRSFAGFIRMEGAARPGASVSARLDEERAGKVWRGR